MSKKKEEYKEVKLELTEFSAQKVAAGLLKALPGDKVTIEAIDTTLRINIKNSKNSSGNYKSLICWLKTFIPFKHYGHDLREIEKIKCKNVTISKCEKCDKIDISWE